MKFISAGTIILSFFLREREEAMAAQRRSDCPLKGYHDSTHIQVAFYAHLVFIFIYWGQWNLKRIEFSISDAELKISALAAILGIEGKIIGK